MMDDSGIMLNMDDRVEMPMRRIRKADRRRVCRNLFGGHDKSPGVTACDEVFAEQKRVDFSVRWGWNVDTDSSEPNSNWEWELLEDKDVPEALQRLGGCRARTYSTASLSSGEDACHSRSGSFSTPATEQLQGDAELNESVFAVSKGSQSPLITDFMRTKRSRTSTKESRTMTPRPADTVGH